MYFIRTAFRTRAILFALVFFSCNNAGEEKKAPQSQIEEAKAQSENIIQNLPQPDHVLSQLDTQYFNVEQTKDLLFFLNKNCKMEEGSGELYGSLLSDTSSSNKQTLNLAYHYSYDCNDLRFIFTYIIDHNKKALSLTSLSVEDQRKMSDIFLSIRQQKEEKKRHQKIKVTPNK